MSFRTQGEPLEPGLAPIFRMSLATQLGLTILNVLVHIHLGRFAGCPWCIVAVCAAGNVLLLGYLSWTGFQRRLGRYYLPLALILDVFLALLVQNELLTAAVDPKEFVGEENIWQVFIFLLFPLVLVAWQYNFRAVVLYCLFTGGLEIVMLHWGGYEQIFADMTYQRTVAIRTIAFLVVGHIIAHVMRKQRQQRQELAAANRRLSHYAATLEQLAITQERNRVARELHDTLAHTLSGLAVQLEAVHSLWQSSPAKAQTMLEEALDGTRSGLGETRKAIQALRASPLEDMGLSLALRDLAEAVSCRTGASLELELPQSLDKLPPDVEQCFYRLAQEALENIARHAGASRITVQLARQERYLIMTVTDDGQGFDVGSVDSQRHLGIKGMRERAEMIGGSLSVHSQAGKGTTVRLTWEAER